MVGDAWLTGRISTDEVAEITTGLRNGLKASQLPAAERDGERTKVLGIVLPVAEKCTVQDVRRVIGRFRLLTSPAGEAQAEFEAVAEQTLRYEQVGSMSRITAWLTNQNAAAVMTVLQCKVATRTREGDLAPEGQLPDGVAPHVTVTVDLDLLGAGLGGDLAMPGSVGRWRPGIGTARSPAASPMSGDARRTTCTSGGTGGTTDLDNCVMLCVRHHHAVHEGGWSITRAADIPPGGTGFWEFTPPARQRRP